MVSNFFVKCFVYFEEIRNLDGFYYMYTFFKIGMGLILKVISFRFTSNCFIRYITKVTLLFLEKCFN